MFRALSAKLTVGLLATLAAIASAGSIASAQQRPRPENVPANNPGTATGVSPNVVTSKLLIYAKNGLGTTNTSTNGEFASQLVASATINNQFSLQWSRSKPGVEEQAMFYVFTPSPLARVGGKAVTMPAGAKAVNISYSMPNVAPGTYMLMVVGNTGSSSKVNVTYSGKDNNGEPVNIVPSTSVPQSAKFPVHVTGVRYTPSVGAPGESGYKRAKLYLTLRSPEPIKISKIDVEVWSGPWTNPELLTSSKGNSPIIILKGKSPAAGGYHNILKDHDYVVIVSLSRTSKNEIQDAEGGPGFYSAADWGYAFAQTTTASFRWNIEGKLSDSQNQSAQKAWTWGAP